MSPDGIRTKDAAVSDAQAPALQLVGLWKRFGETTAVDHVDLTVPPGLLFGLVGSNGRQDHLAVDGGGAAAPGRWERAGLLRPGLVQIVVGFLVQDRLHLGAEAAGGQTGLALFISGSPAASRWKRLRDGYHLERRGRSGARERWSPTSSSEGANDLAIARDKRTPPLHRVP
jgi:hypothetical protein